jgi:hypothetical protein
VLTSLVAILHLLAINEPKLGYLFLALGCHISNKMLTTIFKEITATANVNILPKTLVATAK